MPHFGPLLCINFSLKRCVHLGERFIKQANKIFTDCVVIVNISDRQIHLLPLAKSVASSKISAYQLGMQLLIRAKSYLKIPWPIKVIKCDMYFPFSIQLLMPAQSLDQVVSSWYKFPSSSECPLNAMPCLRRNFIASSCFMSPARLIAWTLAAWLLSCSFVEGLLRDLHFILAFKWESEFSWIRNFSTAFLKLSTPFAELCRVKWLRLSPLQLYLYTSISVALL